MESRNDQKQEVIFKYGKCSLEDLSNYYKQKGEVIPGRLIKLLFKRVS